MAKKKELTVKFSKVEIPVVAELEKATKCGFYVEKRDLKYPDEVTSEVEPLVRLRCESKDAESEDFVVSPFMDAASLIKMIQGCIYLHPAIIAVVKTVQANAEKPEEK